MMKKFKFSKLGHAMRGVAAAAAVAAAVWGQAANPVASPGATVVSGNARFTVLTSGMVRMEWDSTARFTDDASLLVENRQLPVPKFKCRTAGKWLTITTDEIELRYRTGSGRFGRDNLSIAYTAPGGKRARWRWGDKQRAPAARLTPTTGRIRPATSARCPWKTVCWPAMAGR